MALALNARVVKDLKDFHNVTHFIVSDKNGSLLRSMKFLVSAQVTTDLLKWEWLEDSYLAKKILPCEKYLAIDDEIAEKKYNFSMQETIRNGKLAQKSGGILEGRHVYLCLGLAAKEKRKQLMGDLEVLIQAAGGTSVSTQASLDTYAAASVLIVTPSDAMVPLTGQKLLRVVSNGGDTVTLNELFHLFMTQQLKISRKSGQEGKTKSTPEDSGKSAQHHKAGPAPTKLARKSAKLAPTKSDRNPTLKSQGYKRNAPPPIKTEETPIVSASKAAQRSKTGCTSKKSAPKLAEEQSAQTTPKPKSPGKNLFEKIKAVLPSPKKFIPEWKPVFEAEAKAYRSISDDTIIDNRHILGEEGGKYTVMQNILSKRLQVVYTDSDNTEKFLSKIPLPGNHHKEIKGEAGLGMYFYWDACNQRHQAGGTTLVGAGGSEVGVTALRRFWFCFKSELALSVALYFTFGENLNLAEQFFDPKGKFFPKHPTKPPHKVATDENAMEVDEDDIKTAKPSRTDQELVDEYGGYVWEESQQPY